MTVATARDANVFDSPNPPRGLRWLRCSLCLLCCTYHACQVSRGRRCDVLLQCVLSNYAISCFVARWWSAPTPGTDKHHRPLFGMSPVSPAPRHSAVVSY